jgi:RimJ/RimL family protein N-acetyltransferase
MSEAAMAAVDAFFASRADLLLVSGMIENNEASWRIQRRLGFVRVGEGMVASRPLGRRVAHVATWLGRARWEEKRAGLGKPPLPLVAEQQSASVLTSPRYLT